MQRASFLPLSLILLPSLCFDAFATPQGQASPQVLESLLRSETTQASKLSPSELYQRALALRQFSGQGAELDQALERLLSDQALSPAARLLVAAARVQGAAFDANLIVAALEPVLKGTDAGLAAGAAELVGGKSFLATNSDTRGRLIELLVGIAANELAEPALRLAAASSAWNVGAGDGKARSAAREVMVAYLGSSDPALRAQGALALARAGDEISGLLEEELESVARLPGEQGALASAYLKTERLRSLQERKYKALEENFRSSKPLDSELAQVDAVMDLIEQQHLDGAKMTREDLLNAALDGMLGYMDEHSTYMEPEVFTKFNQDLEADYGGIGAYVGEDRSDGLFTITRPIYSGPAYKNGLHTDDKIVRIDDWPTVGEKVEDIIKRLKGKPGTQVTLYIWRRGMDPGLIERPSEEMKVTVERARIEIPAVAAQLLPGGIGLLELKEFSRVASDLLAENIETMQQQGLKALVLDLRNNPGGLLQEAVAVCELFLPKGSLVVSTEYRSAPTERLLTERGPLVPAEMPLIVLVNRFSASASEIVSGALQDHKRAVVVGERSYGKGSVQNLMPVPGTRDEAFRDENGNRRFDNWEQYTDQNGNGMYDFGPHVKLTIAHYLLPSGRSIHRVIDRDHNLVQEGGVRPEEPVELGRIDAWRLEERWRIRGEQKVRTYVDEHWLQHRQEFQKLAVCDQRDISLYPDFEAFYMSLATVLPREDVRFLIREELRRRVQDERGAEFPGQLSDAGLGDFQEDRQLQHALVDLLQDLGQKVEDIPEFASTFQIDKAPREPSLLANLGADSLKNMQALLEAAKVDGKGLSSDELERALAILASLGYTDSEDR